MAFRKSDFLTLLNYKSSIFIEFNVQATQAWAPDKKASKHITDTLARDKKD